MNQISDGKQTESLKTPSERFRYFASNFLKRFMIASLPVVFLVMLGLNLLIDRYNGSLDVLTFVPHLISGALGLYLALVITLGLPVSAIVGLANRVPRDPTEVQSIFKKPAWIQFCVGAVSILIGYIVTLLVGGDGLGILLLQMFMVGIWFVFLVILIFMREFWIVLGMAVAMLVLYSFL